MILAKAWLIGLAFVAAIGGAIVWIALLTPAPIPVGLMLLACLILWTMKSQEHYWKRGPRRDDEPPFEGDRSPIIPRPPLTAASARQPWPED